MWWMFHLDDRIVPCETTDFDFMTNIFLSTGTSDRTEDTVSCQLVRPSELGYRVRRDREWRRKVRG